MTACASCTGAAASSPEEGHLRRIKPASPLRLGIAICLLGQKVRYDGKHRRDGYITLISGKYFKFVPVYPEVAIGLRDCGNSLETRGQRAALHGIGELALRKR